ncbi:chromosome partitioning ATP-binding protein [Candidatus Kinetoplastibacterium oncopeltii TCC290E]|uniref:Iron-sulfur cluster carrier protein n=1 Tax=Candidatus Kinetoplastidibacterium stringomonadis TCC290E TaxID=1208920 RepID=M1LVJ4_9PROT|nr:iron-sulfur cluster carrier protein ApbC [Candidatus Kinetoplastibacterium oncopeltii]AGF48111.1 chromosome partitioning ATP-binding protein [Candidatus Kinetoplastibacterium oncopeltii TCC290E]
MNKISEKIKFLLDNIKKEKTSNSISYENYNIRMDSSKIIIELELGYYASKEFIDNIKSRLKAKVLFCVQEYHFDIVINVKSNITAHVTCGNIRSLPSVKNIITVSSGKGGVGKSTLAVNLALSLSVLGANVGILDADIYGPSIPIMLGIFDKPNILDNGNIAPLVGHGLQANSIGFMFDHNSPAIWRGPIMSKFIEQLVNQTEWYNLDYLIIDMPPGTGDVAITLASKVPVIGSVVVTTPQDVSLIDVRRCLSMFKKLNINVLGIVENMSFNICTKCNHKEYIFGTGGGQRLAKQNNIPLLGMIPLDNRISKQSDSGFPIVIEDPLSDIAKSYLDIALKISISVASLPRENIIKFPKIMFKKV